MDLIAAFPTVQGYDSILVVVDRLTKDGVFMPTRKTVTSGEVAGRVWYIVPPTVKPVFTTPILSVVVDVSASSYALMSLS